MQLATLLIVDVLPRRALLAIPMLVLGLAKGDGGAPQARHPPYPQADSIWPNETPTGPTSPIWAEGLVLFGVVSIDGMQTAYFGSTDRQTVIALALGEKLANGIQLVAVYEQDTLGTISAALRLNDETAIVGSAGDVASMSFSPLIIEPAPISQLPPPPCVPLVFSAIAPTLRAKTELEGSTETHSLPENDRPAVVAWPRKIAN